MISTTSITNNNIDIKDNNNLICEATGCYKQAKNEIKIEAGEFGQIKIFLCKNCVPKFTAKGDKLQNE